MGLQLPKRARRIGTWAAVSASLLLLGACSNVDQDAVTWSGMLVDPASDRGALIAELWEGAWIAALLVGAVVWGLIGYASFVFRRRRDDEVPVQTRYNLPIEILYTVAPVIMVLVLFFFTVETQNKVLASASENGDADHVVEVVGQKWSWTFNYVDEEAVDGDTVYTVGTPADIPTLVLPVDESVQFNLSSPDVIHSFWVPSFVFKMDVVPGRDNSFSLTPTREGTFAGKCAELCGVYHSRMLFEVEVVSADEYATYLQGLKDQGNVGLVLGNADSRQQAGLEDQVQDDDTIDENGESQ
ncbi:MAG TPA: cytochrome c oxidase subunit II [Nocardioidaceae bacterium]|nr:cytochrome c oxidase subunit II [Nocardioidaceae bacterium]